MDYCPTSPTGSIGHELRTPITIIRGYAEMLAAGEITDDGYQEAIDIIHRQAEALEELVQHTATLFRLDRDREQLPATFQEIDVDELIMAAVGEAQAEAQRAGIHLRIVSPLAEGRVKGDVALLQEALDCLLSNAIKFTAADGRVRVAGTVQKGDYTIAITDTGIGIRPKHLGKIWEQSYQVDGSTTRRYGGAGLGLAVVKAVVEVHDGRCRVESTPDKGSTFSISLPIR